MLINPDSGIPLIPPIGLDYLYDNLKSEGHEISFFDMNIEKDIDFIDFINKQQPHIIGITVRNIDNVNILYPRGYISFITRMIRKIKKKSQAEIIRGYFIMKRNFPFIFILSIDLKIHFYSQADYDVLWY
ncbi:MAG: cobalamin-dependent protein [Spirochaetales bacterium]|nr:cobalamin-dependent protein [Spirochaetales bacterium]